VANPIVGDVFPPSATSPLHKKKKPSTHPNEMGSVTNPHSVQVAEPTDATQSSRSPVEPRTAERPACASTCSCSPAPFETLPARRTIPPAATRPTSPSVSPHSTCWLLSLFPLPLRLSCFSSTYFHSPRPSLFLFSYLTSECELRAGGQRKIIVSRFPSPLRFDTARGGRQAFFPRRFSTGFHRGNVESTSVRRRRGRPAGVPKVPSESH